MMVAVVYMITCYRSAAGDRTRSNVLQFLGRSLRSVHPSPAIARRLTAEIIDFLFVGNPEMPVYYEPLEWLLTGSDAHLSAINEEITSRITSMILSPAKETRLHGLSLAVTLGPTTYEKHTPSDAAREFWFKRRKEVVSEHSVDLIAAAAEHPCFISAAQSFDLITVSQALGMADGFRALMTFQSCHIGNGAWFPRLLAWFRILAKGWDDEGAIEDGVTAFRECAAYLTAHPDPPWITGRVYTWSEGDYWPKQRRKHRLEFLTPACYLGGAAVGLMSIEKDPRDALAALQGDASNLGVFSDLYRYIECRASETRSALPDLPVPESFRKVFKDWATGKISFVRPAPEQD